jgi:hypothetical protein
MGISPLDDAHNQAVQNHLLSPKFLNLVLCDGDHDIDCKIPGFGGMKLKSEFVKKV